MLVLSRAARHGEPWLLFLGIWEYNQLSSQQQLSHDLLALPELKDNKTYRLKHSPMRWYAGPSSGAPTCPPLSFTCFVSGSLCSGGICRLETKGEWGGDVSSLSPRLGQRFSELPCRGHSSHGVPSATQVVCLDSGVCFLSLLLRSRHVRSSPLFSGWPCLHTVNGPCETLLNCPIRAALVSCLLNEWMNDMGDNGRVWGWGQTEVNCLWLFHGCSNCYPRLNYKNVKLYRLDGRKYTIYYLLQLVIFLDRDINGTKFPQNVFILPYLHNFCHICTPPKGLFL